jgi:hypothetical protein
VKDHKELKIIRPNVMDSCRIENIWFESLAPFLLDAEELILRKNYSPKLIFQLDETSCLLSKYKLLGRVGSCTRKRIPCQAIPQIYRCTLLFIVTGDGEHMKSHLLLPSKVDQSTLGSWKPTKMKVHYTMNGWMDKDTFSTIISEFLLPHIMKIRETLGKEEEMGALLLCDGHASRMNLQLMRELGRQQVEVGIFPSHSSSETQALDLCPNAQFKHALQLIKPTFPSRANMKRDLPKFVDNIQDAAEFALLRRNVKKGWERSGFLYGSMENKLNELHYRPPGYLIKPKNHRFSISGEWISRPKFLAKWEEHGERKSGRKERRRSKRILEIGSYEGGRKRRKIVEDDNEDEGGDEEKREKEKTTRRKRKKNQTSDTVHMTDSELSESSDTTTESDLKDDEFELHPVQLLHEKEPDEVVSPFSTTEFMELNRIILEQRMTHVNDRRRKPARPYSPDPILKKRKLTRKELDKLSSVSDEKDSDDSELEEKEKLQLQILNFELGEDEDEHFQDSDYVE